MARRARIVAREALMTGVRVERQGDLVVLRLDKARGNAIDEAVVDELTQACAALEKDSGVRGVLLASAHPKLFCPGLDLVSLIEFDRVRFERFMTGFRRMLVSLFSLSRPMVAAVGGHAVAGGSILALTADWRVLKRGGASIGLNEVKVGVPLPWSVSALLRATVPPQSLARVALLARNLADEEALAAGLVDELAAPDGFEETCLARLREFAEKDPAALAVTKSYLRADARRQMQAEEPRAVAEWLDGWFSPSTQDRIRATVASLTRKG
jgi:enoyl-CoA hydratase